MPIITHKRAFLARRLGELGLIRLIERFARKSGILVLTYHRILERSAAPYYEGVASATPEGLRAELESLARTHRLLTLEEVAGLAEDGFRVDRPSALVTFDDGYLDNFELALPILRSLGIPATFFLPAGFLESPRLFWWDHIAYVIARTRVPVLRLDWPESVEIDLLRSTRPEAIARLVQVYLDRHNLDESRFREGLEKGAEVDVDENRQGRELTMSWDQARILSRSGMSIGSHTVTHRELGALSEEVQRVELAESRRILESRLDGEVRALAYPYGWPGSLDDRTPSLARESGYRLAFNTLVGVNRPGSTDPFAIRRIGVGFADPPILHRARWALHEAFDRSPL
ncbi:polysaccharide deacetylase family protein [Tundrisphaera lichenicola]|uniref:polysaccharide deacetylase family protein n=1 Tax=Tundrisphaera lichenicola TaxID=2029860 RepID=UPI003EB8C396